jgi:hypothetical protein
MKVRLRLKGYEWTDAPHFAHDITQLDNLILEALLKLSRDLDGDYGSLINTMVQEAQAKDVKDYPTFRCIADEVFSDGVRWSHVVTILVFASSLAFANGVHDRDVDFISLITEWVNRYFSQSEVIVHFLENQGGWSSITNHVDPQAEVNDWSNNIGVKILVAVMGVAAAAAYYFDLFDMQQRI